MLTFTKSYKTTDNQIFSTIEEAQVHELKLSLKCNDETAKSILKNKEVVSDILTIGPNSRPKARSIHGGTKTRSSSTSKKVVSNKPSAPVVVDMNKSSSSAPVVTPDPVVPDMNKSSSIDPVVTPPVTPDMNKSESVSA